MRQVFDSLREQMKAKAKVSNSGYIVKLDDADDIINEVEDQWNDGWIPFTQREMTEEEKESFGELNYMLDCPLPDEDEDILITYKFKDKFYVDKDIFLKDGSECYLDSGRDLVTEAVAWKRMPAPYQKGE